MQSRKVCASAWQDRKVVMIMYTNSDSQCITSVPRRLTNGSKEEVSCPLAITSYNKNMAAVWIKVINPEDIITVVSKAESSINIYITCSLMWPSRTPSSFTGDGQEPLKLPSSSSGSSWPRSLLGDIVAVIELGIMAPWSSPFHFLTSQWRSPQHLQDSAIEVAALTAISRRKDTTASGTAMSVAYGCATLEIIQRIACYCDTNNYFSTIGTIRWCIVSPYVIAHLVFYFYVLLYSLTLFYWQSSTAKSTPIRKWEIQISYLQRTSLRTYKAFHKSFFLVSPLPLHKYLAWGLEG